MTRLVIAEYVPRKAQTVATVMIKTQPAIWNITNKTNLRKELYTTLIILTNW